MKVACPHCSAAYNVDDRRIPAAGLNVRCPKCQSTFPVRPPVPTAVGPTPVPLPNPAARGPANLAAPERPMVPSIGSGDFAPARIFAMTSAPSAAALHGRAFASPSLAPRRHLEPEAPRGTPT